MANVTAGHFALDWIDGCRSNECDDETLEVWLCRARNAETARITTDGSVWCDGSWLSQKDCDKAAKIIDRGV
jgi:hypothetical protein